MSRLHLPNGNPNALIPVSRSGNGIDEAVEPDAGVHNHATAGYCSVKPEWTAVIVARV